MVINTLSTVLARALVGTVWRIDRTLHPTVLR